MADLAFLQARLPELEVGAPCEVHAGANSTVVRSTTGLAIRITSTRNVMRGEATRLRRLALAGEVAVPAYLLVVQRPGSEIGVYRWIAGSTIAGERKRAVADPTTGAILGRFLRSLHAAHGPDLPRQRLRDLVDWYRARFAGASSALRGIAAVAATFGAIARIQCGTPVVVHGDLNAKNVLWNGRVAGIIDFSSMSLSDPARDFGAVFYWGSDAVLHRALDAYGARPGLRQRAVAWALIPALDEVLRLEHAPGLARAVARMESILGAIGAG